MTTTAKYGYTFDHQEAFAAYNEWGANCGPNALAFACQVPLESVRHVLPDFDRKRYTNPTMMTAGLKALGRTWTVQPSGLARFMESMFADKIAMTRIQWCGPWTEPGANPKWAYRHTHWIASWRDSERKMVFDVNGGIRTFEAWEAKIVPEIVSGIPRANGCWFPTHIWRLTP